MGTGDAFTSGIRQAAVADIAAVSIVHVNRVLHALQDAGLIKLDRGVVRVPEPRRLAAYAEFDAGYLHLAGRAEPDVQGEAPGPAGTRQERARA